MSRLSLVREPTPERVTALAVVERRLDAAEGELWRTFIAQTEHGLRRQALATLDRLIGAVDAYPPERRATWVAALCRARWDAGALERVPFPLLERLVLPELRRGHTAKLPEYARWLGRALGSSDLGGGRARAELRQAGLTADALLREALEANPDDAMAREALIDLADADFDYYIHELPAGVLADADTFRCELDEFDQLVAAHGVTERYAARIRTWRFHCQAWGEYLRRRTHFLSYADYLSQVHPDHPETARALLPWLRHKREWRQVQTAASQMLHEVPGDSPERWPWLAYRAEAALALGDHAAARADLSALALSPHAVWQNRARQLTTIQQRGAQ